MQLFAHYVDAYLMTSPNGVLIFIFFFVFVAFFLNVIVYAIGCLAYNRPNSLFALALRSIHNRIVIRYCLCGEATFLTVFLLFYL